MRQAIITKYLGPTNFRPGRIKATARAGFVTVEYDHGLSQDGNHARAAKALADKFGWGGVWVAGGMPSGDGNVYVNAEDAIFGDGLIKDRDGFEGAAARG